MVKKIITNSLLLGVVLGFAGCSYKGSAYTPVAKKTVGVDTEVVLLSGHAPGSPSISRAADATKSAWFSLQQAAMYTLNKGDKYFAIYKPKLISNVDGSTMNTPEEFAAKCTSSGAASVGSAFDAFGIGGYGCNIASGPQIKAGFIEIVSFKEKPKNILVYDSNEIITYLKSHDLFIEADDYTLKGQLTNKNSVMYESYANWYHEKRDK